MEKRENLVEKIEQRKDLVEKVEEVSGEDLIESLSGVRGIWGEGLTQDVIRRYSLAYQSLLRGHRGSKPKIVIGYDTRPSSKPVSSNLEDYLNCEIIDIGPATTPVIEHAVRCYEANGGVIISGSHNPLQYNGLKFLRQDGGLLDPELMGEIIRKAQESDFSTEVKPYSTKAEMPSWKKKHLDPLEDYIEFVFNLLGEENIKNIKKYYAKENKRKIIVDPNGGSACTILEEILSRLEGVEYKIVNDRIGSFGRENEPKKETLEYLVDELNENDIAFGFDCDADRAEVVINDGSKYSNEFGNVVSGQYLLGLITKFMLEELKEKGEKTEGKEIVVNDATSYLVRDIAKPFGVETVEVGTGEINVVNKMIELNAVLSGEGSSSGFIHPETRCRDGILTMLFTLAAIAEKEKSLGEIIDELPKYYTYRNDELECNPSDIDLLYGKLISEYEGKEYKEKGYTILSRPDEFSGIKAVDKDGRWVWFRSSATTAGQFRIFADSKSEEKADSLLEEGVKNFQEIKSEIEKVRRK